MERVLIRTTFFFTFCHQEVCKVLKIAHCLICSQCRPVRLLGVPLAPGRGTGLVLLILTQGPSQPSWLRAAV